MSNTKTKLTTVHKYLTFTIKEDIYAFPALYVKEIIGVIPNIVQMPVQPNYVKGIIYLRDKIIPIVDTYIYLSNNNDKNIEKNSNLNDDNDNSNIKDLSNNKAIVILESNNKLLGFLVEEIQDIFPIEDKDLSFLPKIGKNNLEFVKNVYKINKHNDKHNNQNNIDNKLDIDNKPDIVMILDVERLFNILS